MTQQLINVGTVANDGSGDVIRTAFGKCNANFTDLYDQTNWPNLTFKALPVETDMFVGYDGSGKFRTGAPQLVGLVSELLNTVKGTLQIDGNGAAAPRALVIATDVGQAGELRFNSGGVTAFVLSKTATGDMLAFDRYVAGSFVDRPVTLNEATGMLTVNNGLTLIGASTTSSNLTVGGDLRASGALRVTRSSAVCAYFTRHDTATVSYTLSLTRGRGDATTPAALQNGDGTGIIFNGQCDATTSAVLGSIRALCIEPTPSATAMGMRLSLHASALGTVANNEVARFEYDTGLSLYGANPVIDQNRLFRARPYPVSTLPTPGTSTRVAYASNCRVFNGAGTQEASGAGTGSLVSDNGTAWKIVGTNVTAVA